MGGRMAGASKDAVVVCACGRAGKQERRIPSEDDSRPGDPVIFAPDPSSSSHHTTVVHSRDS